jgi:hypothetical protein
MKERCSPETLPVPPIPATETALLSATALSTSAYMDAVIPQPR